VSGASNPRKLRHLGANVVFGALLRRWWESMVTCYEEELSDSERQELHDWEASPAFTGTGDWPGWLPHIGPRPGQIVQRHPLLMRRRA
jgi:hypothetical protein